MAKHLPIDGEYIVRAGKELTAQHGVSALVQVDKQISICESEGLDSVVEVWKLIREAIIQTQQSDSTMSGAARRAAFIRKRARRKRNVQ